jgi:hypothetical protein
MAMTPDKMYRPEISGPKTPGSKFTAAQAIKKKLNAMNANTSNPSKPIIGRPTRIKPIGNKEVNPVYRNQGFM